MNTISAIQGVLQSDSLQAAGFGFIITFILCVFLVITKNWHGSMTMDFSEGVQKFHTAPTPRVGGIPIVLGLFFSIGKAPMDVQLILTPILIAGMPAFIFGVAEDMTKRVSVTQRLFATMASGLLAWLITDYSLARVDIWGVDMIMKYTIVSVVFTVFAVAGVANAINIIDGFNGLASSMSTIAFIGYALMAWQVGDYTLAGGALILAACVWGFFWVNWPFGKVFLGDGGAYFIGFAVAWVAVLLLERNPSVSSFAVLGVCTHPVIEVLFSIYRRKVRKSHPGMPDRMHFHSLCNRRYIARKFKNYSRYVNNSITGVLIGSMSLTSSIIFNLTLTSIGWSVFMFIVLTIGYVAVYVRMLRHHWSSPMNLFLFKYDIAKRIS